MIFGVEVRVLGKGEVAYSGLFGVGGEIEEWGVAR